MKAEIPVVWWDRSRGSWDHGLLMGMFEKHQSVFIQHNVKEPEVFERAIVIVTGNPESESLKKYLEATKSGVVIFTSDEEARWDISNIVPDHLEVWAQYYKPGMDVDYRMLMGPPSRLKDFNINPQQNKKYLWSFVGQVQNEARQQCINAIKDLPGGFLHTTDLFGGVCDKAIPYQDYLDILCQSKYIICPAGSFTVESFRMYEAIKCGAIPIVDVRSPFTAKHFPEFEYWSEVYPQNELIKVDHWDQVKSFLLEDNENKKSLKTSSGLAKIATDWYWNYKTKLEAKLVNVAYGGND